MSKPVVFVIGASGNIGSATLSYLSANYGDQLEVRAGVRNPQAEKAKKLTSLPNVAVVQATMGDSSLVSALKGVDTLCIVPPPMHDMLLAVPTAEYAKQAGVKHIAIVSGLMANFPDTITGKVVVEIEGKVSALGVPYTIVRLPLFMENFFSFKDSIIGQSMLPNAQSPDKKFVLTAVEDMGKASAKILVNPQKYTNQTVSIIGDFCSYSDLIEALSEALGREIKYVHLPYDVARKGMLDAGVPEAQTNSWFEMVALLDASSPAMVDTHPGVFKGITGDEPLSLKEWVKKNIAVFQ